jgi:hypothetical protein
MNRETFRALRYRNQFQIGSNRLHLPRFAGRVAEHRLNTRVFKLRARCIDWSSTNTNGGPRELPFGKALNAQYIKLTGETLS